MPSLPERVAQLWRDSGSEVRPGVQAEALLAFQLQNSIPIPEELAAHCRTPMNISRSPTS